MKGMTFRSLRKYVSKIDRISICKIETSKYENFICIDDVPKKYDRYYVVGIGMIESEFYKNDTPIYAAAGPAEKRVFLPCIEVAIARKPKE